MAQPKLTGSYTVFGVESYEVSVAHYVDWLGFKLDWEWRSAPGEPAIVSLSRDEVSLMLNEGREAAGSWLTVFVDDLPGLVEEWNSRRPDGVTIDIGPPYDIPTVAVTDSAGNRIQFQQPVDAAEQERRERLRDTMRDHVRARLDAGEELPTPQALVDSAGRPLGIAIEVLAEFRAG